MKFLSKIIAALVSFFQGPGGRMLMDVGAAVAAEIGPVLFGELVTRARIIIESYETSAMPASVKHDRVATALKALAKSAGVELSDTTVDLIIKGALLLIRKAG